jgi:hypothetical protein
MELSSKHMDSNKPMVPRRVNSNMVALQQLQLAVSKTTVLSGLLTMRLKQRLVETNKVQLLLLPQSQQLLHQRMELLLQVELRINTTKTSSVTLTTMEKKLHERRTVHGHHLREHLILTVRRMLVHRLLLQARLRLQFLLLLLPLIQSSTRILACAVCPIFPHG